MGEMANEMITGTLLLFASRCRSALMFFHPLHFVCSRGEQEQRPCCYGPCSLMDWLPFSIRLITNRKATIILF
jgi:hypothetical protein